MISEANEHQAAIEHREVVERLWTKPVFEACDPVSAIPDASSVLIAEARCGYIPEMMKPKLPTDARIIALDPSRAMLDQARARFEDESASNIFFVPQAVNKIAYADEVFRAVICLNGLVSVDETKRGLSELARVTGPGGTLMVAVPMQGSFPEFYDILDEAFRAHKLHDVLGRMYKLRQSFVTPSHLHELAQEASLIDPVIHEISWDVSFDSGHALLQSPLVRETFFPHWMNIIRSSDREPILRYVTDAIDTYWHNREFRCKVVAGCLTALR